MEIGVIGSPNIKKNWYQMEGSKWAEFWTILHLPYTLMCLSFLSIGFGIVGVSRWDVFGWVMLAYFLGLSIAAHAFDQLPGMGSSYVKYLTPRELKQIGVASLTIALLIIIYWMFVLQKWQLLWLLPVQTFFVWAYPISKFLGGRFHTDFWFAVSFGFIPVMLGYYINTSTMDVVFLPWAILAAIISGIQITLSRYVRALRKEIISTPSNIEFRRKYIYKPELAIKLLCIMVYMLSATVLLGDI